MLLRTKFDSAFNESQPEMKKIKTECLEYCWNSRQQQQEKHAKQSNRSLIRSSCNGHHHHHHQLNPIHMLFSLICSKLITFKLLIIHFIFNFELCASLRLVMLEVPSPSYAGESIELSCIYELEHDKLYSVKWYKNDVEFYRYVPKDWPPGQFLPIMGIKVDLTKSGMNSVFLKFIDINTAGLYRCEVSAEAPSFVTAEGEKELQVTVLPSSGPEIVGLKSSYKVGDEVNLTCISAKSKPFSTLRWYINNKEVKNDEYHVSNASHVVHDDNLETSSLRLRFVALEKHFKSGIIRVKCTSTVIRIHTMSNEVILRTEVPMTSDRYLDNYLSENLSQPKASSSSISALFQSSLQSYNHAGLLLTMLLLQISIIKLVTIFSSC